MMASKQLGKLRQWAGEVISSRDKTTVSEEFAELERDIELRREGALKLLATSESYQKVLSKKKKCDAFADGEKLLPVNALGVVMVLHGEEFGEDSALGASLVSLGRAHCRVATLQESFALAFKDTFINSIEKFTNEIKEYDVQRKKLDSRRLSYDAAVTKVEKMKSNKKEKERKDAEEEMERAKERYEETSEEVQAHMHAIQENEGNQLRELSSFLDLEITFVEQYLGELMDVKSEWFSSNAENAQSTFVPRPAHNFTRRDSIRSKKSSSSAMGCSESPENVRPSMSRRNSAQKSHDENASRILSRQTSYSSSRKRADSTNTNEEKSDKEKDKEKDGQKGNKMLNVADWATSAVGSAVGSVTGRNKKGREKFAFLHGDEGEKEEEFGEDKNSSTKRFQAITKKLSREKALSESQKTQGRILRPRSLRDRKIATALYSFQGSNDELSFEAGDEIIVVNEVLDDWWMGELRGKTGLFPTTHVEVSIIRYTPPRKSAAKNSSTCRSEDDAKKSLADAVSLCGSASDQEDHDLGKRPLSPNYDPNPFYGGVPVDTMSIISFSGGDNDKSGPPVLQKNISLSPPTLSANSSSWSKAREPPPIPDRPGTHSNGSPPTKKAPPPPPPRRTTVGAFTSLSVPARVPKANSSQPVTRTSSQSSSDIHDRSPFDSVADLRTVKRCGNFMQNPLQAKGMCNNCFHFH